MRTIGIPVEVLKVSVSVSTSLMGRDRLIASAATEIKGATPFLRPVAKSQRLTNIDLACAE
ncbi:MAG: hypothetical protein ACKVP0_15575 [Pirellulaceae bacterium]